MSRTDPEIRVVSEVRCNYCEEVTDGEALEGGDYASGAVACASCGRRYWVKVEVEED